MSVYHSTVFAHGPGLAGWMNGTNGSENEWLNAKKWIRRLVPQARECQVWGRCKTMVSLGTVRSNPPPRDFRFQCTYH